MTTASIAVGVITYRRPIEVVRCLESVAAQSRTPDEVIVCDDSEDRATETAIAPLLGRLASLGARTEYVRSGAKRGQPRARNEVLERCSSTVIAFVDDDAVCDPGHLAALAEAFADPAVAGCGGPALSPDGTEIVREGGLNRMTPDGRFADRSPVWVPERSEEVDVFLGANMAFRTEAVRAVGGFDEQYAFGPAFREETDVMVALRRRGGRLVYRPEARVTHHPAASGGSRTAARQRWIWTGRNQVYFLRKHFGLRFTNLLLPVLSESGSDLPSIPGAIARARRGDRQVFWFFAGLLLELVSPRARPQRPGGGAPRVSPAR